MFIEIDKVRYVCNAETCTSQKGNPVVRIISSDAPVATGGFILYTDDEQMSFDRSDYKYLYREEGNVKEYTTEPEEIIPAQGYTTGVPISPISRQLTAMGRKITSLDNEVKDITPYEQSKTAYFGEVEKVFYGVPNGLLTVHMDGEYTVERIEDRVYVRFERLDGTKEITIMVQ